MEGFYYDAHIKHVIKNNLYFAILHEEDHKDLKNTVDTVYFCIDNELVYNSYYFDFGPLNISCLYKYCNKLNGYLQYAQKLKRVVHYTSFNASKLTNAAFLIGCYAIMYLKMEPSKIHEILENISDQYREFVDASQGGSEYTIGLLDCFRAIQKAINFNFFQLNDFNVIEYDFHDKLQNGDMNWLVPRKFLAFIGPTENGFMNGHHPEFYIKYFLDNDIKTVIRLNNKLYDASIFKRSGIEHFELFFPDGTVPSKNILLQFLEISETARAAIAVHCKAGLGRTGSLIGAYIIKHYQMTAREAIAWMRICRPGSVIGQQQGWLEKIEGWLWNQGSRYRIQHFGEGDKIPRHKYGIYSKEWLVERENLIKHVQKRRLDAHGSRTKYRADNVARLLKDLPVPTQSCTSDAVTSKRSKERQQSARSQKISIGQNGEQFSSFLENTGQVHENSSVRNSSLDRRIQKMGTVCSLRFEDDNISSSNSKKQNSSSKHQVKRSFFNNPEYSNSSKFNKSFINTPDPYQTHTTGQSLNYASVIACPVKFQRREQYSNREQLGEMKQTNSNIRRDLTEGMIQTQGDKLNEIKAKKFVSYVRDKSPLKMKSVKRRHEPEAPY